MCVQLSPHVHIYTALHRSKDMCTYHERPRQRGCDNLPQYSESLNLSTDSMAMLAWVGECVWAKEKRKLTELLLKKLGDKDVVHNSNNFYKS